MRRVRNQVACSLDGYITGLMMRLNGFFLSPPFDFEAIYAQFDKFLMGLHMYEIIRAKREELSLEASDCSFPVA